LDLNCGFEPLRQEIRTVALAGLADALKIARTARIRFQTFIEMEVNWFCSYTTHADNRIAVSEKIITMNASQNI
jgi:hypothetical protein